MKNQSHDHRLRLQLRYSQQTIEFTRLQSGTKSPETGEMWPEPLELRTNGGTSRPSPTYHIALITGPYSSYYRQLIICFGSSLQPPSSTSIAHASSSFSFSYSYSRRAYTQRWRARESPRISSSSSPSRRSGLSSLASTWCVIPRSIHRLLSRHFQQQMLRQASFNHV